MDTEFRSYAVGIDPLSVYVETCSTCGYAAYDLSKEMPGHILPEVRKAVDRFYVSEGLNKTEVPTHKKYELTALKSCMVVATRLFRIGLKRERI